MSSLSSQQQQYNLGVSIVSPPQTGGGWWPQELQNGFHLNQHTSECCRCGPCQPNIDWVVGRYDVDPADNVLKAFVDRLQYPSSLFVKEDASWLGRTFSCLAPGCRETTYTVHRGQDATGPTFLRHHKDCTFGIRQWLACIPLEGDVICIQIPCCCNLPYLETFDAVSGRKLGTSRVLCDAEPICCPKFGVFDANDNPVYRVHPDLCICNQCIVCCRCDKGQRCCYNPYYLRDPKTLERIPGGDEFTGIIDLWNGLKKECCSKKNLYGVKFPPGTTDEMKATLMGTTLLYDLTLIEQNQ